MNEELEQFIQEVKSILPWLLAAGIVVAGYHGVRKYVRDRRAAAAESVSSAYTTEELEDAAAKFKGSKAVGVLRLRLAKSYFDSANYDSALEIYESLDGKAPDGFADVVAVGKAQCLEGLGRFDEAQKAFDAFAEANEKSFLALTAKLGSARCVAQAGNRDKAIEALEALKGSVGDDELSKARVESTLEIVKRYEKRAERSLFEAADAAQKQLEAEGAKDSEKKPAAEAESRCGTMRRVLARRRFRGICSSSSPRSAGRRGYSCRRSQRSRRFCLGARDASTSPRSSTSSE